MKIILMQLIVCIFSAINTFAQSTFQKAYGLSSTFEYFEGMAQTSDSGYVLTGNRGNSVYLLVLDSNGGFLWDKTYSGFADMVGNCVKQTFDLGYIIGGYGTIGQGMHDALFIKTDSIGNLQWSKTLGSSHYDENYTVEQTSDSGFIFAGNYDYGGSGGGYLLKTDANGNTLWIRKVGGLINSMRITNDGGFIIVGGTSTNNKLYLLKTDSNGIPLWAKSYGGSTIDRGTDLIITTDGGYVITGTTCFGIVNNNNIYVVKTDSIGNLQWSRSFGNANSEFGSSILQANDGGYILSGATSLVIGHDDTFIIKTNSVGNLLWSKSFALDSNGGGKIFATSDNGYIIGTDTENPLTSNNHDFLIIKTDSQGNSSCNTSNYAVNIFAPATQVISLTATSLNLPATSLISTFAGNFPATVTNICQSTSIAKTEDSAPIMLFPNPTTAQINITSTIQIDKIEITNLIGQIIYSAQPHEKSFTTELKQQGIYFVSLISNNEKVTKKVIVQ